MLPDIPDIICFCHLRWNFVYQRPQHLLSRFAAHQRVFVVEDPVFDSPSDYNEIYQDQSSSVWIITPHLQTRGAYDLIQKQRTLLESAMSQMNINKFMLWYYSPMALAYSPHLEAELIIYDCMDELSAFKNAPPALQDYEKILFSRSDIVFTGGYNLYKAKKDKHDHIFPFPSSIDKHHFAMARHAMPEPDDQKDIPGPRIGFYGVIDERFDIELLREIAVQRSNWHFILIGPVLKIDPSSLPQSGNIHYLGPKKYKELPAYLAGWNIAIMPFARNESTTYISPTKTPEYLAGGKPVVSTSIADVVDPYGRDGLVHIADEPETFIRAVELELSNDDKTEWLGKVDDFLSGISWDKTWKKMDDLIRQTYQAKKSISQSKQTKAYV